MQHGSHRIVLQRRQENQQTSMVKPFWSLLDGLRVSDVERQPKGGSDALKWLVLWVYLPNTTSVIQSYTSHPQIRRQQEVNCGLSGACLGPVLSGVMGEGNIELYGLDKLSVVLELLQQ